MYADDTTIYLKLEDLDQNFIETEINNELENVNIWLKQDNLSLNAQKTSLDPKRESPQKCWSFEDDCMQNGSTGKVAAWVVIIYS